MTGRLRDSGIVLRRVVCLVGVVLLLGLAGCGGPPHFTPAPGKVRISPIPAGHGEVNFPANVTVDGVGLYVFTHGVRRIGGGFQLNVSAIPNPGASSAPGNEAVQHWLGVGDTMTVDGLTLRMLAVYEDQGEGDVEVTSASGDPGTTDVTPS